MTVAAIAQVLGGKKRLKRNVGTEEDLVRITREGLPAEILRELTELLHMDRQTVSSVTGIPVRTLSRRLSSRARLSPVESDRMVRFARVVARAKDTFDDMETAATWLKEPNIVFKQQRPIDLLDTEAGTHLVETVLLRIAYGVYS